MQIDNLKALNEARANRQAAVLIRSFASSEELLVVEGQSVPQRFEEAVKKAFKTGKSFAAEIDNEEFFFNSHLPSPRLVIIGAVHISQALAQMGQLVDFDVEVIDPRTAFATPERFKGINLKAEWPQDVLNLDRYTALAAVTHDPKIDDYPLIKALECNCFYVGALGSRKTHAKRVERLLQNGVTQDKLQLVHSPIGLDIGSASPAEIALAIMAEVVEALRKREPVSGQ